MCRRKILLIFVANMFFAFSTQNESMLRVYSSTESLENTTNIIPNRRGKFLFDAIFRISSGITNAFGYEADEYSDYNDDINIKTCDCGEYINDVKNLF